MPALPNVANVLRVDLGHFVGTDATSDSRFYVIWAGTTPTTTILNAMATTTEAAWNTHIKPTVQGNSGLLSVTLTDLTSTSGAVGRNVTTVSGTRAGTALPASVCALINFSIARRYRGGKPRIYMPMGAVADVNTRQFWLQASATAFTTGWQNFMTATLAAASGGTTLTGQVNVSYYNGFTAVQNPVTLRWRNVPKLRTVPQQDPITGSSCNLVFGSQRRRNRP